MATSPHDTAKGIACETRSEPLPLPASLHGCRINTKSKKNMFTHLCCRNNRIIISFLRVRMN